MSLSGSFFNAINRTNILRNMILKRLFLILPPPHKLEKNSHLYLLIFTPKFSNIKEVRQD